MAKSNRIPLAVDINRVLEVLAAQIYQSPLALLRENLQNAFDAILLRRSHDTSFEPRIEVTISRDEIKIQDNGIGMSREDIENHFWRAGSSSKNTPEAKAAGVVGTFGIGAMANFGIAKSLNVETEDSTSGGRTRSTADRDNLSATEDCIEIEQLEPTGETGTVVTATMYPAQPLDQQAAIAYLTECVKFVDVPVIVNNNLVSQKSPDVPRPATPDWIHQVRSNLTPDIVGDIDIASDGNGEVWVSITNITMDNSKVAGTLVLRSGQNNIQTFRSGFSLAATTTSSVYQFGGIADLTLLRPTAGREALESQSQQVLQNIVTALEHLVSLEFALHDNCDRSNRFMQWISNNNKMELADRVTIRFEPGDRIPLSALKGKTVATYIGQDANIIKQSSAPDARLAVLSSVNPRRKLQNRYLNQFCTVEQLDNSPKVKKLKDRANYSIAESSLVFRINSILESDYFLLNQVELAEFTHPVPVLVDTGKKPVCVRISTDTSSVQALLELYRNEYEVFGHMIKDFVRTTVFPKLANLVPSATREGAEAFLKRMRTRTEVFEYEIEDTDDLSSIWKHVIEGRISVDEGARRSQSIARRNVQVVESPRAAIEVIPDLEQVARETPVEVGIATPAISRTDIETDAKLLTLHPSQPAINGYRCFIAVTDRVFDEKGDFFLEPHKTDVVWGGQRALFVFEHHSGEFGLYYDIQAPDVISAESGGGPRNSATLFLKNRIFIPVPPEIQESFIPTENERKRLEIKCDILYTKSQS